MLAITRKISRSITDCALTHVDRSPIDFEKARQQHERYEALLTELGCEVRSLPAEEQWPDGVFVEDTAVITDAFAVIARPGHPARQGEIDAISAALKPHRSLHTVESPGTLDGGDVLTLGWTLYVGVGQRTNTAGKDQLAAIASEFGFRVVGVPIKECLHLKTAVTQVGEDTLLINPKWIDPEVFDGYRLVTVDEGEPFAANALWIDNTVVYSSAFPRTAEKLERAGIALKRIDYAELGKAEGGVTCCSLVFASHDC